MGNNIGSNGKIQISTKEGLSQAILREAGVSGDDVKKIKSSHWNSIFKAVNEQQTKATEGTEGYEKLYSKGSDLSGSAKDNYVIQDGAVLTFAKDIWEKILDIINNALGRTGENALKYDETNTNNDAKEAAPTPKAKTAVAPKGTTPPISADPKAQTPAQKFKIENAFAIAAGEVKIKNLAEDETTIDKKNVDTFNVTDIDGKETGAIAHIITTQAGDKVKITVKDGKVQSVDVRDKNNNNVFVNQSFDLTEGSIAVSSDGSRATLKHHDGDYDLKEIQSWADSILAKIGVETETNKAQMDKEFTKKYKTELNTSNNIVDKFNETSPQNITHKKNTSDEETTISLSLDNQKIVVGLTDNNKIDYIKIMENANSNKEIYYGSNGGVYINGTHQKHTYQSPEASGFEDLKERILVILKKMDYTDVQ